MDQHGIVLGAAVVVLAVGVTGEASAEVPKTAPPPTAAPAPAPTVQGVATLPGVFVSKVKSEGFNARVVIVNASTTDQSVELKTNYGQGEININHKHTIKARSSVVDFGFVTVSEPLCDPPMLAKLQLIGGTGVDARIRQATHVAPKFKVGTVIVGSAGPSPGAEIANKQATIESITPLSTYECTKTFKMKVHVRNGTPKAWQKVRLVMFQHTLAGAEPAGPTLGEVPVTLASKTEGDFIVETSAPVVGRSRPMYVKFADPNGELAGYLGYYKQGQANIDDVSEADWKLQ